MKRISQIFCLLILLLPFGGFSQNDEYRELLVYIHQMDHYWDWHNPEDNNISISYTLANEATKSSMELNHENKWYRFYLPPSSKEMEIELRYRGKEKEVEIPAGEWTTYLTIYDERIFPYQVEVFNQADIYPLLDPDKVRIEGRLDLPETVGPNFPKKVQLSMPFVKWDYSPTELEATIEAEIDWRSAKFEFQFTTLFPTIGFVKLQERYYPVMIQPYDYDKIKMEWELGENNELSKVSDFDAESHHRHVYSQDFLNHRYPNGLSAEGYEGLVAAFVGSQEKRTDSLVAWSRSIASFYENYRSDPEDFLQYVNQIGQFSYKDLFEEAYDSFSDRKLSRVIFHWDETGAVFLISLLISLFVFAVAIVLRVMNNPIVNSHRFDMVEGILFLLITANVLFNALIHRHHMILEADPFGIWALGIAIAMVFYLNQKFLVPRFLLKRKWVGYLLLVVGINLIFFLLAGIAMEMPLKNYRYFFIEEIMDWELLRVSPGYHSGSNIDDLFMTHFFMLILAPIYGLGRHVIFNRMPSLKIQKEALNAELHNLKTQISPHFFFNSLNTVYGFALGEESPKTAEAITKMSNLMRFAIYHGDKDFIPLEKELDYLADYIELQELRMNPMRHKLNFHIEGEAQDQQIAPLLLITLVENAFKHGISMSHDSYIYVDLFIQKNGLILTVENSVHPSQKVLAGGEDTVVEGGIGLSNTRQRLDLLYKGKYDWQIEESEDRYYAQLSLDL